MDFAKLKPVLEAIAALLAVGGAALLVIKIRAKRGNTTKVVQKNINTGGGDVAGGNITKHK